MFLKIAAPKRRELSATNTTVHQLLRGSSTAIFYNRLIFASTNKFSLNTQFKGTQFLALKQPKKQFSESSRRAEKTSTHSRIQ